jgi:tRNA (guanine37-N1)-methyltransferase
VRIDVVTIFPEYFGPLDVSLLGKARERGLVDLRVHDLRDQAGDVHRTVDDAPFGGGPGMVMKPEPWYAALRALAEGAGGPAPKPRVVVPTPSGRLLTQALVEELAAEPWLAIACGRYEGIDRRVVDEFADDEVSLGDYVLAGGEAAALVIVEAVTRLLPGVVGNAESVADDSHTTGLLEGPVYTRPASYEGRDVPPVLLSGDHGAIARWRRDEALRRTATLRPDLLARVALDARDRAVLGELDLPFPLLPPAVAD